MIITKTPFRIPLGGGGTDLPFFHTRFGGSLVCATINYYTYITVNKRNLYDRSLLKYSKTETIKDINEVEHPLIREALRLLDIKPGVEVTSMMDLPSGTGLGSSSSFLVGLLNALHRYKGEYVSPRTLAEESSKILMDILKEPCGKQDQYAAAYGNFIHLAISKNGNAVASPLNISDETVHELERNLFLFYTGITRETNKVLTVQKKEVESDEEKLKNMLQIKKIGEDIKKALETGNCKRFGEWMNMHWQTKRNLASSMTNPQIDKWYDIAMKNGAIGGKIMGAGGGGFFLFYCENEQKKFVDVMQKSGLKSVPFRFDFEGSKILLDVRDKRWA